MLIFIMIFCTTYFCSVILLFSEDRNYEDLGIVMFLVSLFFLVLSCIIFALNELEDMQFCQGNTDLKK